jgi:hypothetical protein
MEHVRTASHMRGDKGILERNVGQIHVDSCNICSKVANARIVKIYIDLIQKTTRNASQTHVLQSSLRMLMALVQTVSRSKSRINLLQNAPQMDASITKDSTFHQLNASPAHFTRSQRKIV